MFDSSIINQLNEVFSQLEGQVSLVCKKSSHSKQVELVEMLKQIAMISEKISIELSEEVSDMPHCYLKYNGDKNGVSFSGVPGGHEFSSLILAILNSDGKGKLPDELMIERIQNLNSMDLKTYVSLSCENCPEVVQSLNLISILNPSISHEMRDGEYFSENIRNLKVQGVPSVISGDELVSSGKSSLIDLLEKLERKVGGKTKVLKETDLGEYDVAVIGGGPAGSSAAIYSSRKGLKTIVLTDRVGGQLQDTQGIENFISIPFTKGPELSHKLSEHMDKYDIKILEHRRVEAIQDNEQKEIKLNTGEKLKAKSVIITTGAKWKELNIPGEKEYIGRGVAFCPHCDGPYYKGKKVAVIGGGNSGVEAAIDLAGIVKEVVLIEFGENLKADEVLVNKLKSLSNISILISARTSEILGDGNKVIGLKYENRVSRELNSIDLDGVFVQIGLIPNSSFLKNVVELNNYGEIIIDEKCRTSIKGIYAAGDVTITPYKQIIISMGEGAKAALSSFEDLSLN